MVIKDKRLVLEEIDSEMLLFDNPSFDASIIGVTEDNRAVYDFDKMIEELAADDEIDLLEAQEFIEYNTVRALPYFGEHAPIIIYPIPYED